MSTAPTVSHQHIPLETFHDVTFYTVDTASDTLSELQQQRSKTGKTWFLVPHADGAVTHDASFFYVEYEHADSSKQQDRQYASLCQAVCATMRFAQAGDIVVFSADGASMFRNRQEAELAFHRLIQYFESTLGEPNSLPITATNEHVHRAPSA